MKVLILSYTNLKNDPRPYRQIKSLYQNVEVHTIGTSKSGLEKTFTKLIKNNFIIDAFRILLLKLRLYDNYYWDNHKKKILSGKNNSRYNLLIAHEIRLVPLALKLAKGSPVILDAHEYSPKNFDDSLIWRFFIKKYYTYLCDKYLPMVDKIITVSPGIVNAYKKNYSIKPILITNACEYAENIAPQKIDNNKIRIIHHGIASSSRKLELLIDMMNYLDDKYELNFMLVFSTYSKHYFNKLKRRAKNKNIKFLQPVSREKLIRFSNDYDIGIHFVPPTNYNLKYGLGNKFFEYVQSRLAIAIGPDIEMCRYVNKYNLGIISETWEPSSIAEAIKKTDMSTLNFYKNQCHKYAKELSSNENDEIFVNLVNSYK
jgi:hypothetical protein